MHTPTIAIKMKTCARQNDQTPLSQICTRGISGAGLQTVSIRKKSVAEMPQMTAVDMTNGCVQGSFWPAVLRKTRKVTIVRMKVRRPGMSKDWAVEGFLTFEGSSLMVE